MQKFNVRNNFNWNFMYDHTPGHISILMIGRPDLAWLF